jgi:protein pelota
LKELSI